MCILFIIVCALNACVNKNKKLCEGHSEGLGFTFTIPINITPSIDTIMVGDTLWLESNFSNSMYNSNNSKNYTVNNFDFDINFTFLDLSTNPIYGTNNVVVYNIIGGNNKNGSEYKINYNYTNNMYHYKSAIIFTQPGYYLSNFYSFITTNYLSKYNRNITQCPDEMLDLYYSCNNNQNNNYYMLQNAIDPSIKQLTQNNFNLSGGFCVYVK